MFLVLMITLMTTTCLLGRNQKKGNKPKDTNTADIIIYGGICAAFIVAVELKKPGKSVIVVSPDKHLGGLTSGGLAREFYR